MSAGPALICTTRSWRSPLISLRRQGPRIHRNAGALPAFAGYLCQAFSPPILPLKRAACSLSARSRARSRRWAEAGVMTMRRSRSTARTVFSTAVLGVQAFGLAQAAAEDDLLRRAAGLEDIGVGRAEPRAVQGHADLLAFGGSGGFGPGLAGIFLCAHAYFLFAPGAAL